VELSPAALPSWLAVLPPSARFGAVIEHTLLRSGSGEDDHRRLCMEARELGCRAVCVHGRWLPICHGELSGTAVLSVAVADFPGGRGTTAARSEEVRRLAEAGADEIDIVAPLAAVVAGEWEAVERDLRAVILASGRPVKVILESAALSPAAIAVGAGIVRDVGAFAVKTSTGFHPAGGATVEAVRAMREVVGNRLRVKASGGVRSVDQALRMLQAGADLIGTSAAGQWTEALGAGAPALATLMAGIQPSG
jgi:deoxyribose-phosphate aldolase